MEVTCTYFSVPYLKYDYTDFHENSTDRLFVDSRSQKKEVRKEKRALYIRNPFLYFIKNS